MVNIKATNTPPQLFKTKSVVIAIKAYSRWSTQFLLKCKLRMKQAKMTIMKALKSKV